MALILMDGFEASPVIRNSMSGAATMTTVSPGRDGIGKAMSINSALNVPTNNPATRCRSSSSKEMVRRSLT
jgi:hypothetical protein